ncbi:thioesterase family protein [bacterium]|jgi:acyl-CoA thioesterase II|nr:thioesterase family protein [bacterium]
MEKTVKSEFLVHSLHAYFLLAGDSRKKILYTVERIHDGRSFCRRRVTGKQDNRAIFVVTASFKTAEGDPKLEYQMPNTEMLALLSYFDVPRGGSAMGGLPSPEELIARGVTPVRDSITGHTITVTICERENLLLTWRKHERRLPIDSPWSDHAAIVAYITDNGTVSTVRTPFLHNETLWKGKSPPPRTGWGGPSLDHSIHFHRRFRCDEWHLYVQRTDITAGGRGLADIKILTNDGNIVASCSQEALMRIPRSAL